MRNWQPGDEVLVTQLDHDANVTPWVLAAADAGATVRWAGVHAEDCTLDLSDLAEQLSPRTRLVAVAAASNAVGTINPIPQITEMAHKVGALVYVDAVHYAPHGLIDVGRWGSDFVAASAYKFFGPHVGVLWGRRELLAALPAYKVRPAPDGIPGRWMTGTQNHEGIVGAMAAVEYLAELGRRLDGAASGVRAALEAAYAGIVSYERALGQRLLAGLGRLAPYKVWGITDPARGTSACPPSRSRTRRSVRGNWQPCWRSGGSSCGTAISTPSRSLRPSAWNPRACFASDCCTTTPTRNWTGCWKRWRRWRSTRVRLRQAAAMNHRPVRCPRGRAFR